MTERKALPLWLVTQRNRLAQYKLRVYYQKDELWRLRNRGLFQCDNAEDLCQEVVTLKQVQNLIRFKGEDWWCDEVGGP